MHHDALCEASGVHQLTMDIILVELSSWQCKSQIQATVLSHLVPAALSAGRLSEVLDDFECIMMRYARRLVCINSPWTLYSSSARAGSARVKIRLEYSHILYRLHCLPAA